MPMGQLIKLENYISRYQNDVYHYPGHFSRLKQENWKSLLDQWQQRQEELKLESTIEEKSSSSIFKRLNDLLKKDQTSEIDYEQDSIPETEEQLKRFFLDSIFKFQLNWASTTLTQMSFLDHNYHHDLRLKYFMQRFPDTYLFMYRPVFKLKNAAVDADIIMITPIDVQVINVVEMSSDHTIIVGDDRSWFSEHNRVKAKFLSPILSLKRTDKIIRSIFDFYGIEMPIKKVVLSRTNQIKFDLEPFQTQYIDRDQHESWLMRQRQLSSPLKHQQLKVAEVLLKHSDTVSVYRPEWDRNEGKE